MVLGVEKDNVKLVGLALGPENMESIQFIH